MEVKHTLQKPYTEEQRIDFIVTYNHRQGLTINETEIELQALGLDDAELLEQAKETKYQENDDVRNKKLLEGIIYSNILFDSDIDQKINLTAKVLTLDDKDTIVWYGMNNDSLLCTKQDLINIGALIESLHSFVWENNAYIKEQIKSAKTIEEVENVEISYERS